MTTTATRTSRPPASPAPPGAGLRFTTLWQVELRKLVDTRAGRWLLLATGVLTIVFLLVNAIATPADQQRFREHVLSALAPSLLLLPVLGILAATAEWSQRTGLVTFALEPRRMRVAAAKLLACLALGAACFVGVIALASASYAITAAVRDLTPQWSLGVGYAAGVLLMLALFIVQGVAFGLLIPVTAGAIVAYLLLPTLWSMAASWDKLATAAQWADINRTTTPWMEGQVTGESWSHLAVSVLVWIVVPLAAGLVQLTRREVT